MTSLPMMSFLKSRYIFRNLCSPGQKKWFDLCRNANQSTSNPEMKEEIRSNNIVNHPLPNLQKNSTKINKMDFSDQTLR